MRNSIESLLCRSRTTAPPARGTRLEGSVARRRAVHRARVRARLGAVAALLPNLFDLLAASRIPTKLAVAPI
jgi:hypothetical protein